MRFCYVRIALLAGILAATEFAESTRTTSKVATLREERSRPSDRNGITSVGDEQRTGPIRERDMLLEQFVREVLLNDFKYHSRVVNKFVNQHATMLEENTPPQDVYKEMAGALTPNLLLATRKWKTWAYFASKYCARNGKDPHEYIVEVMSDEYGAGPLSEILAAAVNKRKTPNLVTKLEKVQISLWLRQQYQPQKVFELLRVEDAWEKGKFLNPRFATWTRYLERLHEAKETKNVVDTEVRTLCEIYGYSRLLKMLTLPENASEKSTQYLDVLKSIGLEEKRTPYQIVSLLLEDVEEVIEQFKLLFFDAPVREFWFIYAKNFDARYPDLEETLCSTLTRIFGLPQLLTMLHAAANASAKEMSGVVLWYIEFQFLEWKTLNVKKITDLEVDLTNIPKPVFEAFEKAYTKYYTKDFRPQKEDFKI